MWALDRHRDTGSTSFDRIIDELVKIGGLAKEIDLCAGQCDHFTAACYKLVIIITTNFNPSRFAVCQWTKIRCITSAVAIGIGVLRVST